MKKTLLFVIFLTLVSTNIFAQYFRIRFEHLSVTEGLSQSSVSSMAQDSHGFMWFATLDGLNKFDGYKIQTYYSSTKEGGLPDNVINYVYSTPDETKQLWIGTADHGICLYNSLFDKFITFSNEKNPETLVNDHITCIAGDSKVLWIGTEQGLTKFNQIDSIWYNYTSENSALSNDYINCLLPDKKGNLWIGTKNGLYILDIIENKFNLINTTNGLPDNFISSLSTDIYGNIWIGTQNGIIYYNSQTGNFQEFEIFKKLPDQYITSLKSDFENILWIGTKTGGLVRFDPSSEQILIFTHNATDQNSLSVNSILNIYEDNANILWVGTSLGGVDKWNRAAQELLVFRHNPYNTNSLSSSRVRSIYEDKNGIIWIGTVDGGLNKWDKKSQRFINIAHNSKDKYSIPDNHVRTILEDSKNRFWIGTGSSGVCILNQKTGKVTKFFKNNPKDSLSIGCNSIWKIIEDKYNTLWFATYGGGLSKFVDEEKSYFINYQHIASDSSSLSNNFCTTLLNDSKGRLWVGTVDGLNLFNEKTNKFLIFRNNPENPSTICNNRIYSIIEAADGTIWVGTKGGLSKYNEDGTFDSFTVETYDLANNVIMGILEDSQHNLWLTTNKGLCKFNPITFKSRTYDVNDGIQSNEFLVGSFYKTKDNMFIVGGINGFNAFYPEKIKNNTNLPSVVITDLMISNQKVNLDTNISLKKNLNLTNKQNDLTFKFVAIDYILPEKNQYAYRLIGYDKDWIYCKYDKSAKYTNLAPGHYTFQVKGSNNDLIWNEKGTKIHVYIKPAYYQTWVFKISVIIFIVFIILFAAWLRLRIEKRQKELLQLEVKRQTKEIREQKDIILEANHELEQQKEEVLKQNEILQQQKEEIKTQRDEIEDQRQIAVQQRDEISLHKKEIEDSIIYAKRIQTAALPENKYLQLLFDEFFIFFKPRDIVSGDFYWATQKDGKLIAIAADCTGHGVPGAFMSMLGISFLHKIVNEKGIIEADKILNKLRSNVISSLRQTKDGISKDGMDISICVIDYETNTFEIAAANNSMYIIRNEELIEYKADKMPIAIYEDMQPFNKKTIEFQKGDIVYMFSDGFADQFGGPKSKKFRYSALKKLFLKVCKAPMNEQRDYIENTLNRWMDFPDPYTGEKQQMQIDDIIVFGIKL